MYWQVNLGHDQVLFTLFHYSHQLSSPSALVIVEVIEVEPVRHCTSIVMVLES